MKNEKKFIIPPDIEPDNITAFKINLVNMFKNMIRRKEVMERPANDRVCTANHPSERIA